MNDTVESAADRMGMRSQLHFNRMLPSYHESLKNQAVSTGGGEMLSASFTVLLIKLAAVMALVALIAYGLSEFYGSIVARGGHVTDASPRQITIAHETLKVPANMIRFRSQRGSSRLERLDLYAHWPDMTGYSEANSQIFDSMEAGAPLLFLSIEKRDMATDMSGRVATIYEKFFSGPPVEAGYGLIRRAFSSQSAYYMEDLYYEANSPHPFAARCIRENDRIAESICIRDIHVGGNLMVGYRFHASLLPHWRDFDRAARDLVTGFMAE